MFIYFKSTDIVFPLYFVSSLDCTGQVHQWSLSEFPWNAERILSELLKKRKKEKLWKSKNKDACAFSIMWFHVNDHGYKAPRRSRGKQNQENINTPVCSMFPARHGHVCDDGAACDWFKNTSVHINSDSRLKQRKLLLMMLFPYICNAIFSSKHIFSIFFIIFITVIIGGGGALIVLPSKSLLVFFD